MSTGRRNSLTPPPRWSEDQLRDDARKSTDVFRRARLEEPVEQYAAFFEAAQGMMEELIEQTVDLSRLDDEALSLLTNRRLFDGFRYLAGPPISKDDLKTLVDSDSIAARTLRGDPELVQRLVETIRTGMDRRRFPWYLDGRDPTPAEREAAIVATAALLAAQKAQTARRVAGKREQEEAVRQALLALGFEEVSRPQGIAANDLFPPPGTFTGETPVADRKADLVVSLWDGRLAPIECKVSNTTVNSYKRLNNDAAVKAVAWRLHLGVSRVVPCATLSGVYGLANLTYAQDNGLTLFWSHRLADLTDWIERTRP